MLNRMAKPKIELLCRKSFKSVSTVFVFLLGDQLTHGLLGAAVPARSAF